MNEATAHRLELARELVSLYAKNEKISVVFVAGSVARGWADEHSDIELDILWKEDPTDEDRMAPIHEANGEIVRFLEWEDNEWSEVYMYKGVKMEMSHFLQETVEGFIRDVTAAFDTDVDKQVLLAAVQNALPLHGEAVVSALVESMKYSDGLREAMLEEYLDFQDAWYYAALADRDDVVMLHEVMTRVTMRVMSVLCAVNGLYVAHPRFKWFKQTAEKMVVKPEYLVERITKAYRSEAREGLAELQKVAEEVLVLAKQ
ncbi:MAG: hypothetical protein WCC10_04920 [Tumebacillaceae bacterium]